MSQKVLPLAEMVTSISAKTGVKKADVTKVLELLPKVVAKTISNGMISRIRGIGNFRLVKTKKRQARNPRTGETFNVPAGFRVKFQAGPDLQAAAKGTVPQSEKAERPKETPKAEKPKAAPKKEKDEAEADSGEIEELEDLLDED